jgi:hypothetical protein
MTGHWLERSANAAILLTSVVVCAAVISHELKTPATAATQEHAFTPGKQMDVLSGVSYGPRETALLFVRSTCRFCTASMPLYQQISELAAHKNGRLKLVAVSVDEPSTTKEYLLKYGVGVDQIAQTDKAVATPTLVLVGANRVIQDVWVGQQDADGARRVLQQLTAVN